MRFAKLVALLALALLAACSHDPVEHQLVGSWQTAVTSPVGAWQLHFTTLSNGQYRTEFMGPFGVPPETGYFTAGDGEWRMEKISGAVDHGTYQFLSADSVLFQTAAGAVVWNRVAPANSGTTSVGVAGGAPDSPLGGAPQATSPTPLPAIAGTPVAAFAPPSFPTATPAAGLAAQPSPLSDALLASGPFGSALLAPFGAATPDAAGASVLGSATGAAPQDVAAALTGAQQQLGSSAQALPYLPRQTLNGLQSTAQQAAADAIGQAAPVGEAAEEATHKAGERLQTFGDNAASRVKRLFTRKRDADDDAPKQNGH